MAPVEKAHAAALAIGATTALIIAALAISKLRSKSKKRFTDEPKEEKQDELDVTEKEGSRIYGPAVQGQAVKSEAAKQSSLNSKTPSTEDTRASRRTTDSDKRSEGRVRPRKEASPKSLIPRKVNVSPSQEEKKAADKGLLVEKSYKSGDDDSTEQTVVSFAEIHFSPGASANEKPKNSPKILNGKSKSQVSDPNTDSMNSSGFETLSLSSSNPIRDSDKPHAGVGISSAEIPSDVLQTSFETDFNVSEGAGESLAVGVGDQGREFIPGAFGDGSVDTSFVLLDVATAPSNCQPVVDVVDSGKLDQSELREKVSLQRLKSSGSDSSGGEGSGQACDTEAEPYPDLDDSDIRETLTVAASNPEALELRHAQTLVKMLSTQDKDLQERLLAVVAKLAAFTKNQNCLRKAGCIPRLSQLMNKCRMTTSDSSLPPTAYLLSLLNAVTNLAVNATNNALMKDCVPALVDLTLSDNVPEKIQLSSLQALTNLSVTSDHHTHYTRLTQRLFDLVDSVIPTLQLQSLKVLVNLSCNNDMVAHLLAAKAPHRLFYLLEMKSPESLVLRWSTLLANIMHTVREKQLTSHELPPVEKAPSPETMYSALYGLNTSGQLRNKVFVLSKHPNEDIRYQAARIYSGLTKQSTV